MILATFHNRTQAFQFFNKLKANGVSVRIINSPREITTSCGLSVMFDIRYLDVARAVINGERFASFQGFYLKKNMGRMYVYEKIN